MNFYSFIISFVFFTSLDVLSQTPTIVPTKIKSKVENEKNNSYIYILTFSPIVFICLIYIGILIKKRYCNNQF